MAYGLGNESTRIHQTPSVASGTSEIREGAGNAYIVIGIHRVRYIRDDATDQFARGIFLTHRVIIS